MATIKDLSFSCDTYLHDGLVFHSIDMQTARRCQAHHLAGTEHGLQATLSKRSLQVGAELDFKAGQCERGGLQSKLRREGRSEKCS